MTTPHDPSLRVRGETVLVLAVTASEVAVRASAPAPPGARLDAETIAEDGSRSAFRFKVHRCRRQPDGAFVLVGATQDLRREAKTVLDALGRLGPGLPPGI